LRPALHSVVLPLPPVRFGEDREIDNVNLEGFDDRCSTWKLAPRERKRNFRRRRPGARPVAAASGLMMRDQISGDPSLGTELRILLACARPTVVEGNRGVIRTLVATGVDWLSLIDLAERHNLVPLLHLHLADLGGVVPPPVRQALGQRARLNAARVLRLTAQLLGTLRELGDAGILAVPYKGPVIGQQLYGNVALRHPGDIDLLIRPADFSAARQCLMEAGFHASAETRERSVSAIMARRNSEALSRGREAVVELHWRFTNRDFGFPLDLDDLAPRLGTIDLAGNQIETFSIRDLLLILALNGARHRWARIEWLCGYAEVLRSLPLSEQSDALMEASRLGIRRCVLLGCYLARAALEAPVDPAIREAWLEDRWIGRLADEVVVGWRADASGVVEETMSMDAFHYHLRERRLDRVRFLLFRAFAPTRPDIRGVNTAAAGGPPGSAGSAVRGSTGGARNLAPVTRSFWRSLKDPARPDASTASGEGDRGSDEAEPGKSGD
jgi:hypothetical protein